MEMEQNTINFTDLSAKDPKIKYSCAKNLVTIAKNEPDKLYPYLDNVIELLDSENNIFKWTAIDIIGYLAKVDNRKKIDKIMDKLFSLLNTGKMITANHVIETLGNIALTKPEHQEKITNELLKIEKYNYDTNECRNIAIGNVIIAISLYFDQLNNKQQVIDFIERQTKNTRNSTKKKAEQFLKNLP